MSVLVCEMKMPKEGCKDCVLVMRKSVYDYCPILKQEVSGNVERGGRPAKCPLIEVPPTADVVERKRGKWEVHNILDYAQRPTGRKVGKCPFCGYLTDEFMSRVDYYHKLTHFCPNCGAEMEGSDGKVY